MSDALQLPTVDPRAELLIDDVVLYDAAPAAEKRPFPKRFLFTGWFDTGKQGREWPGDFEIVLHEKPLTWDAARSVLNKQTGAPWLRIDMRGSRRLDSLPQFTVGPRHGPQAMRPYFIGQVRQRNPWGWSWENVGGRRRKHCTAMRACEMHARGVEMSRQRLLF